MAAALHKVEFLICRLRPSKKLPSCIAAVSS